MTIKKVFFIPTKITLIGFFLAFFTAHAHSQNEGRWYNVEVLVFKRLGSEALSRETWRNDIGLFYPENYRYLQTGQSGNPGEDFHSLPSEEQQLAAYKFVLNRSENYRVLFHQAWTQQMQSEDQSPGIIVSGGEWVNDNKELSGYIKIHIARYLHLTSDLWLITDREPLSDSEGGINNEQSPTGAGNLNTSSPAWPRIPKQPSISTTTRANADSSSETLPSYLDRFNSYPVATLRQNRRMRSNELHYLDHPLMGLLILITPIEED